MIPTPPSTDPPDLAKLEKAVGVSVKLGAEAIEVSGEELRWLCEQAREAERLRAEAEQLEARTGTMATQLLEAVGGGDDFAENCREVERQIRQLTALESALRPLVPEGEVTAERVREAVGQALTAFGRGDMTLHEEPPRLLSRLYAVGRSLAYDFNGLEHLADVVFNGCHAIETELGLPHPGDEDPPEELSADAARKDPK